jgi:hypothetical protein
MNAGGFIYSFVNVVPLATIVFPVLTPVNSPLGRPALSGVQVVPLFVVCVMVKVTLLPIYVYVPF